MIGLDTNILLRVLVDDGSREVKKARTHVAAQAAAGQDFFIDAVVLAETAWVLETVFGYGRDDIARVIDALLANAAYVLDRHPAVAAALAGFRATRADFSDCLIAARGREAGCEHTVTFDKAMKNLPGIVLI